MSFNDHHRRHRPSQAELRSELATLTAQLTAVEAERNRQTQDVAIALQEIKEPGAAKNGRIVDFSVVVDVLIHFFWVVWRTLSLSLAPSIFVPIYICIPNHTYYFLCAPASSNRWAFSRPLRRVVSLCPNGRLHCSFFYASGWIWLVLNKNAFFRIYRHIPGISRVYWAQFSSRKECGRNVAKQWKTVGEKWNNLGHQWKHIRKHKGNNGKSMRRHGTHRQDREKQWIMWWILYNFMGNLFTNHQYIGI